MEGSSSWVVHRCGVAQFLEVVPEVVPEVVLEAVPEKTEMIRT
jgi:hypothetical protein